MQSCLCDMVTDMINLILIDTGYPRYIGRFHIKMQTPVTQEEIDRKQDLSNTLRNISDIMNSLNDIQTTSSKLKILKSLLSECLSDQDITNIIQEEIEKLEAEENKSNESKNPSDDSLPKVDSDYGSGSDDSSEDFGGTEEFNPTEDFEAESATEVTEEPNNTEPLPEVELSSTPEESTDTDDNLPSFSDLGVDGTINQ